jgi:hypothetical protein
MNDSKPLQTLIAKLDAELNNLTIPAFRAPYIRIKEMAQSLLPTDQAAPPDTRVFLADYLQQLIVAKGAMTYPMLKEAIRIFDEEVLKQPQAAPKAGCPYCGCEAVGFGGDCGDNSLRCMEC